MDPHTEGSIDPRTPRYRIYSVPGVAVATFMGSLVPGFLLLAQNQRLAGQPDAAHDTTLLGLAAGAALFATLWFAVDVPMPDSLVHAAQVAFVSWYARRSQADLMRSHAALGGRFHSKWRAAGLGLLVGALLLAALFAAVVATP